RRSSDLEDEDVGDLVELRQVLAYGVAFGDDQVRRQLSDLLQAGLLPGAHVGHGIGDRRGGDPGVVALDVGNPDRGDAECDEILDVRPLERDNVDGRTALQGRSAPPVGDGDRTGLGRLVPATGLTATAPAGIVTGVGVRGTAVLGPRGVGLAVPTTGSRQGEGGNEQGGGQTAAGGTHGYVVLPDVVMER